MTEIKLPCSKSLGARWLVASYFAGTLGQCRRLTGCDDLKAIQEALLELEYNREWLDKGWPPLDVHASGTAFRFVTAAAASTPCADFLVTGTPRLCSRPMEPLLRVLRQAGACIEPQGHDGTGPYHILGRRLKGGVYEIRGDVSSQFISALMLAAPTWRGGLDLRFTTPLVSRPYAAMTARVMERFGACVRLDDHGVKVAEGAYLAPRTFAVEADWSAAGFFYEAAALGASPMLLEGLEAPAESLQGDAATAGIFRSLGVRSRFTSQGAEIEKMEEGSGELALDMSHTPDLVPALAVACVFTDTPFRFTGVRNLRVKESDRLAALENEFRKLGRAVAAGDDDISWSGTRCEASRKDVATYDDHRIAMAFAMAALPLGRIAIADPEVVEKSFEGFWDRLPALGLDCRREGGVMLVERRDAR